MSDINGGFNKTAKELQDFVLNQARIADRKGSKSLLPILSKLYRQYTV